MESANKRKKLKKSGYYESIYKQVLTCYGSKKMQAKNGNTIKVEYVGTLEDGTVFDSNEGKDPLTFKLGEGQIIKGFEEAVVGMAQGEEKNVTLPPEKAYGEPNPELVRKVPKEQLPPNVEEGSVLGVQLPTGQQVPAKVVELGETEATIDMNPQLAGKTLNFKIKILEISEAA